MIIGCSYHTEVCQSVSASDKFGFNGLFDAMKYSSVCFCRILTITAVQPLALDLCTKHKMAAPVSRKFRFHLWTVGINRVQSLVGSWPIVRGLF